MHTSLYREKFWKRTSPICLTVINELWDSNVHMLSRVRFFATPWTVALQAPLSMGFSRREYWAGLPFPFPGDLPDPGIEPRSSAFLDSPKYPYFNIFNHIRKVSFAK